MLDYKPTTVLGWAKKALHKGQLIYSDHAELRKSERDIQVVDIREGINNVKVRGIKESRTNQGIAFEYRTYNDDQEPLTIILGFDQFEQTLKKIVVVTCWWKHDRPGEDEK